MAVKNVLFKIRRVYYLYGVPAANQEVSLHKRLQQLIIATSGSFDVILDGGFDRKGSI